MANRLTKVIHIDPELHAMLTDLVWHSRQAGGVASICDYLRCLLDMPYHRRQQRDRPDNDELISYQVRRSGYGWSTLEVGESCTVQPGGNPWRARNVWQARTGRKLSWRWETDDERDARDPECVRWHVITRIL